MSDLRFELTQELEAMIEYQRWNSGSKTNEIEPVPSIIKQAAQAAANVLLAFHAGKRLADCREDK